MRNREGNELDFESCPALNPETERSPEDQIAEYEEMSAEARTFAEINDVINAGITTYKEAHKGLEDHMSLTVFKLFCNTALTVRPETVCELNGWNKIEGPRAQEIIAELTEQRSESDTPSVDPSGGPLLETSIKLTKGLKEVLENQLQFHAQRMVNSAHFILNIMDREPGDPFEDHPISPDRLGEAIEISRAPGNYVEIREYSDSWGGSGNGRKLISESQFRLFKDDSSTSPGTCDRLLESFAIVKELTAIGFVVHTSREEMFNIAFQASKERTRTKKEAAARVARARRERAQALSREAVADLPF
jgi:hypothetical protein